MRIFLKSKKISDMESKIKDLNRELATKDEMIIALDEKLKGKRVCSDHCGVCQHGILCTKLGCSYYKCDLEIKCKEFERIR